MRLTQPLYKMPIRWIFRNSWRKKNEYWTPKLVVPKVLQEQGVEIIDPVEMYLKPPPKPRWTPPVPKDPRWYTPTEKDHPNWQETPIYEVNLRTKMLEGMDQACILTKTKVMEGLPQRITTLIGAASVPDQDELAQRYIMQANVWDPTKERLPKRFNPQLPGWKFKREYGIPDQKRLHILTSGLLRLCSMLGGIYPDLFQNRRLLRDHYNQASYYFKEEKHIQIRSKIDFLSTSARPILPFASEEEVDESAAHTLPDIYPVAPTIDLRLQHVYTLDNNTGFYRGYPHSHPHTMYIPVLDYWNTDSSNARAILHCYGICLAQAKHRFGEDIQKLPEPISTQCVYTNGEKFSFVTYQLNTLSTADSGGVKNMAWIDSDNYLYRRILPKRAMLRNTRYEDYDPDVLSKFIAMYVNGADLKTKEKVPKSQKQVKQQQIS